MAKEHGIDLIGVSGTGAGGRISKQDIEAHISGGAQNAGRAAEPADETSEAETEMEEALTESFCSGYRAADSYTPPPRVQQLRRRPQAEPGNGPAWRTGARGV